MTVNQLMEDLASELGIVLAHLEFPCELTKETTKINVFQFGLPIEKTAEDKRRKFPYVLIIPEEGAISDSTSPQTVAIQIFIGIYDNDLMNRGKKHVLNVINDICERFLIDPMLKGRYYADEKIRWVVDKDEEYPYHYGAVWMIFNTPTFRRENEYA